MNLCAAWVCEILTKSCCEGYCEIYCENMGIGYAV